MGQGGEEQRSGSLGSAETPPPQQVRDNQGHQEPPQSQRPSHIVLPATLQERERPPQFTGGEARRAAAQLRGGGVSPFPR